MNDFCTWEINGLKFKLDMEDADTAERYQKATENFEKFDKTDEIFGMGDQIRRVCEIFRMFFIDVLGKDAEKIFKDMPDNTRLYYDVYDSFLKFVHKQKVAAACRWLDLTKKYVPGMQEDTKNESTI